MAGKIKDYDFTIAYYPGKSNLVADALRQNPWALLLNIMASQWKLTEEVITVNLVCQLNSSMANLSISNDLVDRVKATQ